MYLGLRVVTVALYAGAAVLLVFGTLAASSDHEQRTYYAWALFLTISGSGLGAAVFVNCMLRREADRNARRTALAVGTALGRRPDDDDL